MNSTTIGLPEPLSEETLNNIERMAGAAFTHTEIAAVLEVSPEWIKEQLLNPTHPITKRVHKALLMRKLELRERIFKDAKNGSSPAQTIAIKIMDHAHHDYNFLEL